MSENIEEFIKQYRNVIIKFSYYYKYSFVYEGIANDGTIIRFTEECDSDEVYEKVIDAEDEHTLEDFLKYSRLRITTFSKDEDVISVYLM